MKGYVPVIMTESMRCDKIWMQSFSFLCFRKGQKALLMSSFDESFTSMAQREVNNSETIYIFCA